MTTQETTIVEQTEANDFFAEAKNKIVFAINRMAQTLRHGCALNDAQAAELPSLRALQLAWQSKGAAYNDGLPEDQKWASCMEGWNFEEESNLLRHTTQSGRLSIRAGRYLTLSFYAGPEHDRGGPGRLVLEVTISYDSWDIIGHMKIEESLLETRPDRIDLLWRIDRHAFQGGAIQRKLERHADPKNHFRLFREATVLLDAKARAEQPWPPTSPFPWEAGGKLYEIHYIEAGENSMAEAKDSDTIVAEADGYGALHQLLRELGGKTYAN